MLRTQSSFYRIILLDQMPAVFLDRISLICRDDPDHSPHALRKSALFGPCAPKSRISFQVSRCHPKANQTYNQHHEKHRESLHQFIRYAITAHLLRSPSKDKKETGSKANQCCQPNPRDALGKIKRHTYGFIFLMAIDPNARITAIKIYNLLQHGNSPFSRKYARVLVLMD